MRTIQDRLDQDAACELLDLLNTSEEQSHKQADEILLRCVPRVVAAAYQQLRATNGFWYA